MCIRDSLRHTQADKAENLRRAAEVAKLANQAGQIVICAFLSPSASDRATAKEIIGDDKFIEVFCDAPEAIAKERAKEQGSNMAAFSDMAAPYEAPAAPDLRLATGDVSVDECVEAIAKRL